MVFRALLTDRCENHVSSEYEVIRFAQVTVRVDILPYFILQLLYCPVAILFGVARALSVLRLNYAVAIPAIDRIGKGDFTFKSRFTSTIRPISENHNAWT